MVYPLRPRRSVDNACGDVGSEIKKVKIEFIVYIKEKEDGITCFVRNT